MKLRNRIGWTLGIAILAAAFPIRAHAQSDDEPKAEAAGSVEATPPATSAPAAEAAAGLAEPVPAAPEQAPLSAAPLDAALAALRAHGLPADPETLARPLIEAAVRALDPGARVIDAKTAAAESPRTPSAADPPPIDSESLPRRLRIVRLSQVTDAVSDAAVRELEAAVRDGIAGIALDLRQAEGDSLDAAARIAARFARPGATLFVVRDARGEAIRSFAAPPAAPGARPLPLPPTIVLVGPETRGAAEVLAAALDRQAGAMSIGRATAGDPLIREIVPVNEAWAVRIATRRLEFPDGGALDAARPFAPRLILPAKASADPVESDPNGRLTDRRKTLPQEAEDRALQERVRGDPELRSATDLLLALIATGAQS